MRAALLHIFAKSDASSAGVAVAELFKNDSMVLNPRMSEVRRPWNVALDARLGNRQ